MKKFIVSAFALIAILSIPCFGQPPSYGSGLSFPVTRNQIYNGWNSYSNSSYFNNYLYFNAATFQSSPICIDSEVVSVHIYTLQATKPIVKIRATRLDTIKIQKSKLLSGQIIMFSTTTSSNDSTLLMLDTGNINGNSTYWMTGATATYKSATLWWDGKNFFTIK